MDKGPVCTWWPLLIPGVFNIHHSTRVRWVHNQTRLHVRHFTCQPCLTSGIQVRVYLCYFISKESHKGARANCQFLGQQRFRFRSQQLTSHLKQLGGSCDRLQHPSLPFSTTHFVVLTGIPRPFLSWSCLPHFPTSYST